MKYAVIAIALFAISAAAASSAGQFLPRAFFTLDAQGHQSDVHPVNAHLLRRLRRQIYSASSSSSSSSSSSGNGGTITFASHSVQNSDGSGQSGSTYTQQSAPVAPAAGVSFQNRFGEDSASGNPSSGSAGIQSSGSVVTNNGYGSTGSTFGATNNYGSVPYTQIQQTVSSFDANGNQKVTTIQGATDHTGALNVVKNEYST
ncbi:secreted protein C [Drosophila eugracilis]|uniref:secreted protein C n=1 Tax=Drosophila eugracilis TaxID=29029 RepID=UPI0007E6019E|nr:secreted protein C [Drosophila eugracilis]